MKVLIITPRAPFQNRGADEQDRLAGIKWFIDNGHEVRVITKTVKNDLPYIDEARSTLGIKIIPVSYKFNGRRDWLKRLFNPLYWDGAAYEYFDPEIQEVVSLEMDEFRPQLVWFDYTYLWPLYKLIHKTGVPIVTRSINFEPEHFLDEDGHNLINRIRSAPKYWSEKRALRGSSWFFAITPKEATIYKKMGAVPVRVLPLRALPTRLIKRDLIQHNGIRIGFMPSTYNVSHNREALRFIIDKVWPALPEHIQKQTSIHLTGSKLPKELKLPDKVVYEGFVPSSIEFWRRMDIALSPSLFGAGMQQKIFEPIALGVPTITSARGIAGYPFVCGIHLLCAMSKEEVVQSIINLSNNEALRSELSRNAQTLSRELFAPARFDQIMDEMFRHI